MENRRARFGWLSVFLALVSLGAGGADSRLADVARAGDRAAVDDLLNSVCASCHAKMDPIGFALEPFDAVGRWRTTDAGLPINASGALPSGALFDGPGELREALLNRPEDFVGTFTRKLLTYAVGRGLEASDAPTIRTIVREAAKTDYAFSSIVSWIVRSDPFRMKAKGPAPVVAANR